MDRLTNFLISLDIPQNMQREVAEWRVDSHHIKKTLSLSYGDGLDI